MKQSRIAASVAGAVLALAAATPANAAQSRHSKPLGKVVARHQHHQVRDDDGRWEPKPIIVGSPRSRQGYDDGSWEPTPIGAGSPR